jgi:hypothetical protein
MSEMYRCRSIEEPCLAVVELDSVFGERIIGR